jgi:hypothetical protein
MQLDLNEAAAVASGSDTRYGRGPRVVAYYRAYASGWSNVLSETAATCSSSPIVPTQAQRSNARLWFYEAIAAHQADTLSHPANAAWNRMWVGYYGRLITMWDALPTS